jgi:hypothetical protein
MLRAFGGLFLGFAFVFLAVLWVRTCGPNPNEEDIDWLHREDVIVVQMKTVGGDDPLTGAVSSIRPPTFTLYGDGTFVITDVDTECTDPATPCYPLYQGRLTTAKIRDLLSFIADQGFLDFSYEQPQPPVSGAPTTYLFAGTSQEQNAVRASALGWEGSGDEWEEFRRLQRIVGRLGSLQTEVRSDASPYQPEAISLYVREVSGSQASEGVAPWPLGIDLGKTALETSGWVIGGAAAEGVMKTFPESQSSPLFLGVFSEGNGVFHVRSRPVLPYEENFPEFEPPSDPVSP